MAHNNQARTLAQWLDYLSYIHPKEIAFGLTRITEVKQRMQIELNCPVIVVGGTNGKGSVCAMLESILQAAGYKTGCHTSPHFLDYNERIRIDGAPVDDDIICEAFARIEQERADTPLTYFEFGVLAATWCFQQSAVEVAILEVGLGGRLDAVNAFDSDCAVITSIGLDHTEYLGPTREQIAREKAGIFRPQRAAVCSDDRIPDAIRQQAQAQQVPLWCLGEQFDYQLDDLQPVSEKVIPIQSSRTVSQAAAQPVQWQYRSIRSQRYALPFPGLKGQYQLRNASAALAALDQLSAQLPVSISAIRQGLHRVQLPGRFQIIPGKPLLILDVAHNPAAAEALADNLRAMPADGATHAVCAMLADKDRHQILQIMQPVVDHWLLAALDKPRGDTAEGLYQVLQQVDAQQSARCFETVQQAMADICQTADENDRIVVFGSFYTVADALQFSSQQDINKV